jgi:hypothetical protein
VHILQLHVAQLGVEALGTLGDVIGEQLAVHVGNGMVDSGLEIQSILFDILGLLGLLCILCLLALCGLGLRNGCFVFISIFALSL